MERGSRFLKEQFNLHASEEVESAATRTKKITGETVPNTPESRIDNYLDRFQEIIDREDDHDKKRGIEALKKILYDKFVIQEDNIPESYFDQQREIARQQGHGDVEISDQMRAELTEVIIADQKSSLDTWVDYLSSDDALYPNWLKYYAFRSMVKLGEFDKEKHKFTKRSKGTTKPFPDLNREALAYVLDGLQKENPDLSTLEPDQQQKYEQLLKGANFAKLYAFAIEQVTPESQEVLTNTQGEWVKYDQGSDHMPLVKSLQGHGTGWCTAGETTAERQLKSGDFYTYYSHDRDGKPTVPRVAIRMQDNAIAEVRGIAYEQNLDPYIGDVVDEKLEEFGTKGKKYQKKSADMKQLTAIEQKHQQGQELTKEELLFLWEAKQPIEGFGYDKDPRIEELQAQRNVKQDLSFALNCKPEQISITKDEALSGDSVFHRGNLDLNGLQSAEGLKLPESFSGDLNLSGLQSADRDMLREKYPQHADKIKP